MEKAHFFVKSLIRNKKRALFCEYFIISFCNKYISHPCNYHFSGEKLIRKSHPEKKTHKESLRLWKASCMLKGLRDLDQLSPRSLYFFNWEDGSHLWVVARGQVICIKHLCV